MILPIRIYDYSRERLIEGRLLFEKIRYAVLECTKTTGEYQLTTVQMEKFLQEKTSTSKKKTSAGREKS